MSAHFVCFDGWPDDVGKTRIFIRPSQVSAIVETQVIGPSGPARVALITLLSGVKFSVHDAERTVVSQLEKVQAERFEEVVES
jgi:hypothetical protein